MITNEREYRVTKEWAKKFADAATHVDENVMPDPILRKALRESYESEAEILRAQIAEYEALRDGRIAILELNSLAELPDALIRARIAAGLTQKGLAALLGLKEQQIQRYEATRYAGASLTRIQAVADALGITIQERVSLPTAATEQGR